MNISTLVLPGDATVLVQSPCLTETYYTLSVKPFGAYLVQDNGTEVPIVEMLDKLPFRVMMAVIQAMVDVLAVSPSIDRTKN